MTLMNKLTAAGWAALLILLTGCPEPPHAARAVSLSFATRSGQGAPGLPANDSEVRDALNLIEAVLASNGFVRDQNPSMATVQGFVASYTKFDDHGIRLFVFPCVYLRDDQLQVVLSEGRRSGGRLSPATNEILTRLRIELTSRFGAQRVKIVGPEQ